VRSDTAILAVILFLREVMHYFERRDLYNRIMARSLPEYKSKPVKTKSRNFMLKGLKKSLEGGEE